MGTPPQRRVDDTEASWREAGTGTFGIGLASSFQGAAGYPLVDGSEAVASGDEAAAAAAAARAGGDGRVLTEDADLGWLTGSDLEALGLAPQETVVKSTSMVRDTRREGGRKECVLSACLSFCLFVCCSH